jgi:NADPH:quinone reductase-like Zn-dependent oxidoreductase
MLRGLYLTAWAAPDTITRNNCGQGAAGLEEQHAMQVLQIQDAYGLGNLKLATRADPVPGPGEAVVRMEAVSLNYRDLLMVTGLYGSNHPLPLVPFSDGAGVVEAVGAGVTRVKPGDRVTSLFFSDTWIGGPPAPHKLMGSLGGPRDGCGQQLLKISAEGISHYPAHLSAQEAATLPCAALTAWRALVVDGQVKAGDTIVLQGTGGVSVFALQFGVALGCEVIISSSSDDKLARARALGAHHTINYRTHPDWSKEVRRLTGGRGADLIVEVGGAKTLMESLRSVRQGGHVAIIGVLSGPAEPIPIPMLIWTNARVQGLSVGSREAYEDMCRAIALHRITPVVDQVFPWTSARQALEAMQGQGHFGKINLAF